MALLWSSPRTFVAGKALTATQMNEITNNISYLYTRPQKLITVRGSGANPTTASTSFGDVDAQFSFSLETSGGAVEFNLLAMLSNTTLNTLTAFDILMDNTTYLSSLTNTALNGGIWSWKENVAAYIDSAKVTPYRVEAGVIPAGIHTYKLQWRVSAGTTTLYLAAGYLCQFSAVETA